MEIDSRSNYIDLGAKIFGKLIGGKRRTKREEGRWNSKLRKQFKTLAQAKYVYINIRFKIYKVLVFQFCY